MSPKSIRGSDLWMNDDGFDDKFENNSFINN